MSLGLFENRAKVNCFDGLIIQIEPTYLCRLKCVMCAHTYRQEVHGKIEPFMDFDLFVKIINQIVHFCKKYNVFVDTLQLFWYGEPFLHPKIVKLIEFAVCYNSKHRVFDKIRIDTEFSAATKPQIEHIFKICHYWNDQSLYFTFSLDALTPKTYNKIRRGGDFKRVMSNIHYLIRLKDKYMFASPIFNLQFIIHPLNYHETNDFIAYWKDILHSRRFHYPSDSISIKKLNTLKQDLTADELKARETHESTLRQLKFKPFSAEFGRLEIEGWDELFHHRVSLATERRPPCASLWKQPSFASNGDLTFCCKDEQLEFKLGNIKIQTLEEMWLGEYINKIRMQQLLGDFSWPTICSNCSNHPGLNITKDEIDNYIKRFEHSKIPLMGNRCKE